MKQKKGDDGVIKYRDTEESIALEKKLFLLPKLNGALHGYVLNYTVSILNRLSFYFEFS